MSHRRLISGLKRTSREFAWANSWCDVIEEYVNRLGAPNWPWGEHEYTDVGLMGLGAERLGWAWLVEARTWKRPRSDRRYKAAPGRVDLWMKDKVGRTYSVEAKVAWWNLTAYLDQRQSIRTALDKGQEAINQVARENRSDRSFALAIVKPLVRAKRLMNAPRTHLTGQIEELKSAVQDHRDLGAHFSISIVLDEAMWCTKWDDWPPMVALVGRRLD